MKRYPAFDPPEYVSWEPDPELVSAFSERIARDPLRAEVVAALETDDLLRLYRELLLTRLQDVALKRWVRQGVISKAWLGTGEEAVTVGAVTALDRDRDVVCPMIRNAGACHMMGMPLADQFKGYLATADSPSGGRDLHVGDPSRGVIQPISHMGTNVPVMAGAALAFRYQGTRRVALTWIGDGATKTGECHEGLNFAAVQRLPAVFVIQNNQVALGTRLDQHGIGDLDDWPAMYGIPSWSCDGNNVLDVYAACRLAVDTCRRGDGPGVVVAQTFRMGGHATHDEREARETFDADLFAAWGRRDPIGLYESWLGSHGVDFAVLGGIEEAAIREVELAAEAALASRDHLPDPTSAAYEGVTRGTTLASLEARPFGIGAGA